MKKVLIVIDMQKDFVDGALANPDAQAIVNEIADTVYAFNGDVVATRDTHDPDYLQTSEGKHLPVVHCVHGTPEWEIVPPIADAVKAKGGKLVDKPTFGYLGWDFLEGYDEATLVGTCTDICVVSNALILKAKFPEMNVRVIPELCAGTTKENHDAAIAVMQCCQVEIAHL